MDIMAVMYAGVVRRERITIDEVPEEYKDNVTKILEGKDEDDKDVLLEAPEPTNTVNPKEGALYIPNTNDYLVNVEEMKTGEHITFKSDKFFTEEVLKGKAYPENLRYDIIMFEATSPYVSGLNVAIRPSTDGFTLGVQCKAQPSSPVARVDIKFISDNYEDMRTSIYLCAK